MTSSRNFRQALVIGGGIAGLLAARVLADHFASVVVLERGRRPEGPAFRRETPQAYHRHGLSLEGKRIFEQLFPGLDQALAQANCPRVAAPQPGDAHGADYVLLRARETAVSSPTTLGDRIVSRPRLEWEVFRRVAQLPNVRFAWERRVTALLPGPDAAFVGGVAAHDHATGAPETLPADLVVDASGRFSKILSWLAAAGYDAPEESAFDSQLLMVTQWFDVPAGDPLPWEGLMIEPRHPHNFRSAMITRIEGQHLLLTLSGKAGFNPPTNAAALMDYLRQLRKPGIYDVLRRAAPAGPPKGFAHTGNRRRHWERVDRFPNNLIVVGDAAHTFNPGHAFGMGLAAQCAEALQQLLAQGGSRHSLAGFSRAYHQAAAAVIEPTCQFVLQSDRYDLEHVWTDRLRADLTQPLTPEPHVAAWQGYAQRAAQEGALPTLQPRLVQLQFPVQEGISRTAAYRQAARQGIVPQQPALPGLQLQAPAALRLHVHASAFGPVPLLTTPHRADFELLVQAFAKRNEPQPLPAATTAYLISGLNNWDRVRALKQDWLRQLQPPPASPQAIAMLWQQAFKRLLPQKALYQDRFMLVHARLAAVPAADLGLPAAEWQRLAPLIEAEHAATIYTLPRLLGYLRDDPLHTELLAYAIGILRAAGQFHADWFLRFVDDALLQDERPPDLA
ncbi:MAG: NAD(P)-binding protein, partial [Anaerolineales bacterium]|nr:NAD(P)-binding protein [Anaerolineales bacterium]